MIRNISLVCDVNRRHQCNVKVVRIMIKDGRIYLNSLHPHWRLGPPELLGFLLELYETSKQYRLPDVEFAWNGDDDASSPAFDWEDGGAGRKGLRTVFHGGPFPLLAWSKSDASFAALVPYSGAFRCTDDAFDSLISRLEDIRRVTWQEKQQLAFGRWNVFCATYMPHMPPLPNGERFPCPRSALPTVSTANPDLLDVAAIGSAPPGRPAHVPLQHQNVYKYLVSTDGWAISSKFDKYLLLGSMIIKAASSRYGYYYDALQPGVHYLPCLNGSRTDIVDVVRWARAHDGEARRVAAAAQAFAVQHLHRGARLCYYRTLMEELGRRMKFTPDCAARKLCVPVEQYIEYAMRHHGPSRESCKYAEVVLRYGLTPAAPSPYTLDQLRAMMEEETFWPRDTDTPPLADEPYFPGA